MKQLINLLILAIFLSANRSNAQFTALSQIGTLVSSATETIPSSSKKISDINISPVRADGKQLYIAVSFIAKAVKFNSNLINFDSLIIKFSSSNSTYVEPTIQDTVYWNNQGNLFYNIIYGVNESQIKTLKREPIISLELLVDKQPFQIELSRKQQKIIKDFFVKNY